MADNREAGRKLRRRKTSGTLTREQLIPSPDVRAEA